MEHPSRSRCLEQNQNGPPHRRSDQGSSGRSHRGHHRGRQNRHRLRHPYPWSIHLDLDALNKIKTGHLTEDQIKDHLADLTVVTIEEGKTVTASVTLTHGASI